MYDVDTASLSSYLLSRPVIFIAAPLILLLCAAHGLITLVIRQQLSPLRRLRGPPSPSFFMGNLQAMHDQENNNLVANWEAEFGSSFVYHGFIGGCRLMTTDPRAVAHLLGNSYDYPKPDFVRDSLATMAAGHDGLLTSEGEQHRRQRKILTPAFSVTSIKEVTPIFWDKASELRDIWLRFADENHDDEDNGNDRSSSSTGATRPRIDALTWLGRATLDIIGLAGFGYSFNSLTDESNELALAFATVFSTARKFRVMTILQVWFPILRGFRRHKKTMTHTQQTIRRIGLSLIDERREAVAAESNDVRPQQPYDKFVTYEKNASIGKDLLSVLIRSNLANSPNQRMNIEEILCQISTFIAAGHETTASALTWTLYALSRNPATQRTLRAHLRSLRPDAPQLDEQLARLPYLDWVVREALRVHSPVTNTMRVCARARDEIPVSRPYRDRAGQMRTTIEVRRHDIISIPIQAINKSKAVWGKDADEFRPERWETPPEAINSMPGLWSGILTFLNGNRSCIGYKFSITEIKIFLYVLLRDIEFTIDPDLVIEKKVNVVTRPFVKSEPALGNQMPLYVRRVTHGSEYTIVPNPGHAAPFAAAPLPAAAV